MINSAVYVSRRAGTVLHVTAAQNTVCQCVLEIPIKTGTHSWQSLLVFRNSDQFERLMNLDGVVSECGGDILPSVQSQQIQDGIANAG